MRRSKGKCNSKSYDGAVYATIYIVILYYNSTHMMRSVLVYVVVHGVVVQSRRTFGGAKHDKNAPIEEEKKVCRLLGDLPPVELRRAYIMN